MSELAPRDKDWHILYVQVHLRMGELIDSLQNHPAFEDGEDLKDWVETIATLLSFRPQTRGELELAARLEMKQ